MTRSIWFFVVQLFCCGTTSVIRSNNHGVAAAQQATKTTPNVVAAGEYDDGSNDSSSSNSLRRGVVNVNNHNNKNVFRRKTPPFTLTATKRIAPTAPQPTVVVPGPMPAIPLVRLVPSTPVIAGVPTLTESPSTSPDKRTLGPNSLVPSSSPRPSVRPCSPPLSSPPSRTLTKTPILQPPFRPPLRTPTRPPVRAPTTKTPILQPPFRPPIRAPTTPPPIARATKAPTIVNNNSNNPESLSRTITFSEFPIQTQITNQYASTHGVIFGPDTMYIAIDGSLSTTTTSAGAGAAVLSGFPYFKGPISGYFVDPLTLDNTTVQSFSFIAGGFDTVGSTRLEWFNPVGTRIGQVVNSKTGLPYERLEATGGNIASFRIGTIRTEPNGFGIDNFTLTTTVQTGVMFRELRQRFKDGSWGSSGLNIPGFDHVALNYKGSVYESHPGYRNGPVYVSADGTVNRTIRIFRGVQNDHVRATFAHDSNTTRTTPVVNFTEIPLDESVVRAMRDVIATKVRSAGFLGFSTVDDYVANLQPDAQKGRVNNSFSTVGLIEWAAEQAGVNNGQGFVPNNLEFLAVGNESYPLLSPELLYYAMQNQELLVNSRQFVKVYLDPVGGLLTDPLGNTIGTVNRTKTTNKITNAFATRKGDIETIIVSNPLPGEYTLTVTGIKGMKGKAAIATGRSAKVVRTTGVASVQDVSVVVPVVTGSRGDVNLDGAVNRMDLDLLRQKIPAFATGFNDPGDMNGDGALDTIDVTLLSSLLNITRQKRQFLTRAPRSPPTRSPTKSPTVRAPAKAPVRTSKSGGKIWVRH